MQRRLVFALALATSPELLLLDEPAEGVDTFARTQMLDDIERFAESGVHRGAHDGERTAVFATHIVDDVRQVADHVLLLGAGEFLGLHKKDALLEGWKIFWVDRELEGDIPGVVEVESGSPTRIVSDSPQETEEALAAAGVRIVRSKRLDLEEILSRLMRQKQKS